MSLFVYCICAAADPRRAALKPPREEPPGLAWLAAPPLAALVAAAPAADDVAAMLAYGQVVAHVHEQLDLVPMRYGSRLPDAAAVVAHLRADRARYAALLEHLAGCVEMGLRVPLAASGPASATPPAPAAGTAAATAAVSGSDYLRRRRQELEATAAVESAVDRLVAELAGLHRDSQREQGWFAGQRRLSVQFLVPRALLPAFRMRLAAAVAAGGWETSGPCAVLTSGPWPPYSFAALADGGDAADGAGIGARSP